MKGRKPTPTRLKVVRGNPGKRALPKGEPKPRKIARVPAAPGHLSRLAANEWRRVAGQLCALGVLTSIDLRSLEAYCDAYSKMRTASAALDEHGVTYLTTTESGSVMIRKRPEVEIFAAMLIQVRAFATEFGLTPSSRTRVGTKAPKDDEHAKDDEFMAGPKLVGR